MCHWALLGPKPYKFVGFGDLLGPKPYKFIGFGDLLGPKPYRLIGFGDFLGPKPYKFIGFGFGWQSYYAKTVMCQWVWLANVAGFWKLLKIYIFNSGPGPPESPKSAGKGGPGPPGYRRTVLGNH